MSCAPISRNSVNHEEMTRNTPFGIVCPDKLIEQLQPGVAEINEIFRYIVTNKEDLSKLNTNDIFISKSQCTPNIKMPDCKTNIESAKCTTFIPSTITCGGKSKRKKNKK